MRFATLSLVCVWVLPGCRAGIHPEPLVPIPGSYRGTLQHGGIERTYLVHVPTGYEHARAAPLVLVLHGSRGTGAGMASLTGGMDGLSDKEGFVVCYPDGHEKVWNDGRNLRNIATYERNIDDVAFIRKLIAHLGSTLNLDSSRVYAAGISNGGMMALRLAFEASDVIAAVAVVAATMPQVHLHYSPPKQPVSIVFLNGTRDPFLPWNGGPGGFGNKEDMRLGTPETIRYWVSHNRCPETPVATVLPNTRSDGTTVTVTRYYPGTDGSEVVLYRIEGGGHTWPGGTQYLPRLLVGVASREISANREIWKFFQRQTR